MRRYVRTGSERRALSTAGAVLLLLQLACAGEAPAPAPPPAPPTASPSTPPATPPDLTACPVERRIACTREWRPVCGLREDGTWHTYGNACDACADRAVRGHRPGACEADAD